MINLEETRDNIKKSSKTDTATAMLKGTELWIQFYCRKEWESWPGGWDSENFYARIVISHKNQRELDY